MNCHHLLLIWAEQSDRMGESELMLCAACGQKMKFEKHYEKIQSLS